MSRGPGRPKANPLDRFWSKVQITDTCWLWTDTPTADGYGRFYDGNKKVLAHRFSWALHFKTDIEGQELDHRCLVPLCVNPNHLRIVTRKQNNENRSGAYRNNPVGVRGVTRNRNGKPFKALVHSNGVRYYLGRFDSLQEAEEAVIEKRLELFTHNEIDKNAVRRIREKVAA